MARKKKGVVNQPEEVDASAEAIEAAETETGKGNASPKKVLKSEAVQAEADAVDFTDEVYYDTTAETWPVLSRAAALILGFRRYYLGTPCIKGHNSPRKTKTSTCLVCAREKLRERHKRRMQEDDDYRAKHNEKAKARRLRAKEAKAAE